MGTRAKRYGLMAVLLLVVALGWSRSYWHHDSVVARAAGRDWLVSSVSGRIIVGCSDQIPSTIPGWRACYGTGPAVTLPLSVGATRGWRSLRYFERWVNARRVRIATADALDSIEARERAGEPPTPTFIQLKLDRQAAHAKALVQEQEAELEYCLSLALCLDPEFLGLGWGSASISPASGLPASRFIVIPYGFVLAAILIPPAFWAAAGRVRRLRRQRAGLCVACGYDLRASTGRCPECGMSIPQNRGPTW